jgi:predicted RNase H-like HicB family nuclease
MKQNAKKTPRPVAKAFKIIVEKYAEGYVTYPLGLKGVVVGEGDTFEEAMVDIKSAIRFHVEMFSDDVMKVDAPVLEAFVADVAVASI